MEDLVWSDPETMHGTPVFRGSRVPLQNLFDYMEGDETLETFLDYFPSVSRERTIKTIEYMKGLLIEQTYASASRRVIAAPSEKVFSGSHS
jgi:uncharacterized protein (DUF433 family)